MPSYIQVGDDLISINLPTGRFTHTLMRNALVGTLTEIPELRVTPFTEEEKAAYYIGTDRWERWGRHAVATAAKLGRPWVTGGIVRHAAELFDVPLSPPQDRTTTLIGVTILGDGRGGAVETTGVQVAGAGVEIG